MRAISLVAAAALVGCASANTAPGASNSGTARVSSGQGEQVISTGAVPIAGKSTIAAPLDKLWSALPAAYQSISIPLTTIEAQDHLLGNRGLQLRRRLGDVPLSRYIDCGTAQGGASANSYDVNLSVITQLAAADATHTDVTTTVDAVAKPVLFTGEYVHCGTTGNLEAWISKLLEATAK